MKRFDCLHIPGFRNISKVPFVGRGQDERNRDYGHENSFHSSDFKAKKKILIPGSFLSALPEGKQA